MEYRRLGNSGLKVSEMCIGTANFGVQCDEKACFAILDKSAEAGVTFVDTAAGYPIPFTLDVVGRSEEIVGKWLRGKREDFVLATKVRNPMGRGPNDEGLSRKHILQQIDASLRRLQTDYVDIYYLHYPDPETPLEETLRVLDELVSLGKIRYFGCSNFFAWQLARMLSISELKGWARLACVEERYNLLFRHVEYELVPLCLDWGVGVVSYSPLAGGFLTGKYQKGQAPTPGGRFSEGYIGDFFRELYWHDEEFNEIERLRSFCRERGRSLTQLALAWVLDQPGVASTIIGASKEQHLDESLPAVEIQLDKDERAICDEIWYRLPRRRLLLIPGTLKRTGPF